MNALRALARLIDRVAHWVGPASLAPLFEPMYFTAPGVVAPELADRVSSFPEVAR
jgi:hypothetical protein